MHSNDDFYTEAAQTARDQGFIVINPYDDTMHDEVANILSPLCRWDGQAWVLRNGVTALKAATHVLETLRRRTLSGQYVA